MSSDKEGDCPAYESFLNVSHVPASSLSVSRRGSSENLGELYVEPGSNDENKRMVKFADGCETSGSSGDGKRPEEGKCQQYRGTLCNFLSGVNGYVKGVSESITGIKKSEVVTYDSGKDNNKQRKDDPVTYQEVSNNWCSSSDDVGSVGDSKGWIKPGGGGGGASFQIKINGIVVDVSGFESITQVSPSAVRVFFPAGHSIIISADGPSKVEIKYKEVAVPGHDRSKPQSHKPVEKTPKKKPGKPRSHSRRKRSVARTRRKTRSRSTGRNTKAKTKKLSSRNKSRKSRPKRTSKKRQSQARPKQSRQTSRSSSPYGSSDSDSDTDSDDDDRKNRG